MLLGSSNVFNLKTTFRNGIPGKDWISGFLKRHPDLTIRSPTALSTVRARMLNPTVTEKYFLELSNTLLSLGIKDIPVRIWNIDETSVPLLHKPTKIIAEKGIKNIPGRVGNSRDNVSVLACINAEGGEIPPMIIVKGKTYKSLHGYNTKDGVPGAVYTYQQRAWMEDALGEIWFRNHFLRHCGDNRPQIIMLDSHSSHETLGFLEAARENNIIVMAFPPHTTQWLCPLDKSVFGPLSREYNRICSEFMAENPNNMVNKWEWPKLFRQAHDRVFSTTNIKSGFKKCGIFPLDPSAVPSQAFAPSQPFDRKIPDSDISVVDDVMPSKIPTTSDSQMNKGTPLCKITPTVSSLSIETPVASTSHESVSFDNNYDVSNVDLLISMLSGELEYSLDETGAITVQISVACQTSDQVADHDQSFTSPENSLVSVSGNWSNEIDDMFSLSVETPKEKIKTSHKRLTSHRVLTSTDILNQKREEFERKEKEKEEKERKRMEREAKRMEKKNKGIKLPDKKKLSRSAKATET